MTRYMPDGWTLPAVTAQNRPFFTSGKLMLQQCASCSKVQHPPEDICIHCQGMDLGYVEAAGTGEVYSYTIAYHAVHPRLSERVPYNAVLVRLDDYPHVRIVGNLIDAGHDEVRIGTRVRATWEEIRTEDGETLRLPQWVQA